MDPEEEYDEKILELHDEITDETIRRDGKLEKGTIIQNKVSTE